MSNSCAKRLKQTVPIGLLCLCRNFVLSQTLTCQNNAFSPGFLLKQTALKIPPFLHNYSSSLFVRFRLRRQNVSYVESLNWGLQFTELVHGQMETVGFFLPLSILISILILYTKNGFKIDL
jgi:hypothetical protein